MLTRRKKFVEPVGFILFSASLPLCGFKKKTIINKMTEPENKMTEQVNKESDHVEQITKEPIVNISQNQPVARIKDPRKIEAGKKLAAYNKKAKNSKKELKENTLNSSVNEENNQGGTGFDISLTTVVALVGLGLTAVDLYLRHKKMNEKGVKDFKMVVIDDKLPSHKEVENEKINKKGVKTVRFSQGMD